MTAGSEVTESQMRYLISEGRHRDTERLEDVGIEAGATVKQAEKVSKLGHKFPVHPAPGEFQRGRAPVHRLQVRPPGPLPHPGPGRHPRRDRSEVADGMFIQRHGRAPSDDRERAGFLAQATRQQTTSVAGCDLAFTPVKSISVLWALAVSRV